MKIKLSHLTFIVGIIFVLHIVAVIGNLYTSNSVIIDIPQHFLAGVFLAMLFVWIAQKYDYFSSKQNSFLFLFSTISFALLGSFIWEIFEFLLWIFLPDLSEQLKWYSPNVLDALSDMAAGLLGSVALVVVCMRKKSK